MTYVRRYLSLVTCGGYAQVASHLPSHFDFRVELFFAVLRLAHCCCFLLKGLSAAPAAVLSRLRHRHVVFNGRGHESTFVVS